MSERVYLGINVGFMMEEERRQLSTKLQMKEWHKKWTMTSEVQYMCVNHICSYPLIN
jgi:hypothetical protein